MTESRGGQYVMMTEEAAKHLAEMAAEEGARRALAAVGLHDEHALKDVQELRDFLSAWRLVKHEALKSAVRWITVGMLALLIGSIAITLKLKA